MPQPDPSGRPKDPTSLFAAATALDAISDAVHVAQTPHLEGGQGGQGEHPGTGQALAALILLRELRDQLAGWEPALIEAAREAGASWADLAAPLGVASRQAAERRYLRVRPGTPGSTGEQRVQATRNSRAADRTIATWARDHAADLRQLAGQIAALADLPARADTPLAALTDALSHNDAAHLIDPLAAIGTHLQANYGDLAARVDAVNRHADQLRHDAGDHDS